MWIIFERPWLQSWPYRLVSEWDRHWQNFPCRFSWFLWRTSEISFFSSWWWGQIPISRGRWPRRTRDFRDRVCRASIHCSVWIYHKCSRNLWRMCKPLSHCWTGKNPGRGPTSSAGCSCKSCPPAKALSVRSPAKASRCPFMLNWIK